MKYRAKMTRIQSTIENYYNIKGCTLIQDSKDTYIEVDTESEAEVIEELNRLEEQRIKKEKELSMNLSKK